MDEILATIRRIIAEDEQPGGPSTASGSTASGATASGAAASGATASGGAAKDTAEAADDIVELTEAINEDGSVRHLAPIGGTSRIAALREPAPVAARVEPVSEPEPSRPDTPHPPPAPGQTGTPGQSTTIDERLGSAVASSAAAAALARLASAPREPRPERELPLGSADRTLEDIVRDLLRPVLQTWLDEHLPDIVERLVHAEIARVGKSGPT